LTEKPKNTHSQGCEAAEQVNVSNEVKARILDDFLDTYLEPAFGSLSKTEIDMLVLGLLEQTKRIKEEDNQYTLSKKLKISQAKAKNLLYNRTLRKGKEEDLDRILDKKTKELLLNPTLQKDDNKQIYFYVENPLLIEHIRDKIHRLKHISDGSFSPHIIKLSIEAFAALVEDYIPNKNEVLKVLKNSGIDIPDGSLKSLLASIFRNSVTILVKEVTGEIGSSAVKEAFNYLPKLWQNGFKIIPEQIKKFNTSNIGDKK
jgi:CRISPR/Cas system CSM-associated protein Csm2 small subunit